MGRTKRLLEPPSCTCPPLRDKEDVGRQLCPACQAQVDDEEYAWHKEQESEGVSELEA